MQISDLKGKKIALLGMGLENISLAGFLLENGITDLEFRDENAGINLFTGNNGILRQAQDDRKIKTRFGDDYLKDLDGFDVIFRTPGIPYLTPEIQEAKKKGVIISSQIKLFFDLCPAKIIGVTGTKGKGTTAFLISEILKKKFQNPNIKYQTKSKIQISNIKQPNNLTIQQFNNVYLLGNIGEAAVDKLESITKDDIVILELSSFQLQDLDKSPHIAVVTNLGEDHLDYHQDINEYWASKTNILKYQTPADYAVINQDYLTAFELASETQAKVYYFSGRNRVDGGAYVRNIKNQISNIKNTEVILIMAESDEVLCSNDELKVVGKHNLENIAAAAIVAKLYNVDTEVIREAVLEYRGLEHRLEFVAEKRGVKYFNDSYATNPISTLAAIRSFNQPIVLIIGGSEKGIDYTDLTDSIIKKKTIKAIVYIGGTGEKIAGLLKDKKFSGQLSPGGQKIEEIVKVASSLAQKGDVILFSPASASFGLFQNYKDRGDKFKKAILN